MSSSPESAVNQHATAGQTDPKAAAPLPSKHAPSIHVIGIGMDGSAGLSPGRVAQIQQADLVIGSDRHLAYFPDCAGETWPLGLFQSTLDNLGRYLSHHSDPTVVILTSGDPLFFGLGRLLLSAFPEDWLWFYPHPSSVQLAFSRLKLPWQDARLISALGRSFDALTLALQQNAAKYAVLTDIIHHPVAIARLIESLDLPVSYQLWVCENLGGSEERVRQFIPAALAQTDGQVSAFAPLNVVVLVGQTGAVDGVDCSQLPPFGLKDSCFLTFPDRPGLMTKREVRILALAELALLPEQTLWDIGAGTGSLSIELARLQPSAQIYALEKTAMGASLIQQNCDRFGVNSVQVIHGAAPQALERLPAPDRVFIGGSGGNIAAVLKLCGDRLHPGGRIVAAIATVETLAEVSLWLQNLSKSNLSGFNWNHQLLQVQLSRSVAVGDFTRFAPLNPVTLLTLELSHIAV